MEQKLKNLRDHLDRLEEESLSPYATLSRDAVREVREERLISGHRQWFSVDADRILHSLAYVRYIDKTQVFSLIPNDHITHRVLHVQLVSKIARTIGRFLRLNEDLIEAIALGHDIGHPPFGHDGERYLSEICMEYGLPPFLHCVQGVHALRRLEKKGRGCNLSLQVLDGILCHDGELHAQSVRPDRDKTFETLNREVHLKQENPSINLRPMTLEGCVVRMSDVISYIGRDIEDAIRLGLLRRKDIPARAREILGETNGTMVYTLVTDLIHWSLERDEIGFSEKVAQALDELRAFNMEKIYKNPIIKTESDKIRGLYKILFKSFIDDLHKNRRDSLIYTEYLNGMDESYVKKYPPEIIVRDFISGMTDAYFIRIGKNKLIPRSLPAKFHAA